jgi:hypothetical protein
VSESIYTEMTPYDHDQYTRNVTALHTQLPAADFDAAWEAGRKLTLEEAARLAMASSNAEIVQARAFLSTNP